MFDEDRIARVARALCVAEGQDSEAEFAVETDVIDEEGWSGHHKVRAPAWTTYAGEARRFIAAARALGLME